MTPAPELLELSARGAALFFGCTPEAFRAVIARQRSKLRCRSTDLRFDGIHCLKTKRRPWRIRVGEPWIKDGVPRQWLPLEEAAPRLGKKPATLRRDWERHHESVNGVQTVRGNGFIACLFSRLWKVCFDDGEGTASV